jgi:hypothetical protein
MSVFFLPENPDCRTDKERPAIDEIALHIDRQKNGGKRATNPAVKIA